MDWRPSSTLAASQARAGLLAAIREYMASQEVLEVSTPTLVTAPVTDPNIESLTAHGRTVNAKWFMRTSPEYAMKRLLAAGWPEIYELGPVYRDGEVGNRHQPEFWMLEWYRHDYSLPQIVEDTVALLEAALVGSGGRTVHQTVAKTYDEWLMQEVNVMSDCAMETICTLAGPDTTRTFGEDRDALLGWLFDTHVASTFAEDKFSVVTHFPASQAALATIEEHSGRALRFEIYLGSLEIANGFVELTDAEEQRARFERDNAVRIARGLPPLEIDDAFLEALQAGLPPCSGVAVGIERVLMFALETAHIGQTVTFAHSKRHSHD
ncbi:MAG: EF-P lysine aminoacylase EpmA [Pseudomonadota bacterium]